MDRYCRVIGRFTHRESYQHGEKFLCGAQLKVAKLPYQNHVVIRMEGKYVTMKLCFINT